MEEKATFTERLEKAMKDRGLSQKDLADRTGFSKSRISQYVSGKYEAKQDGVYKLSKALNVNEAWLMGYDCPMDRCGPQIRTPGDVTVDSDLSKLVRLYEGMTDEGKSLLLKMADSLYGSYEKPPALTQGASGM